MTTTPSPTTEQQIQAMIEQAGRLYQLLQMESEHLNTLRQETDQQMRAIHALKDQIQQDLAKNLSKGGRTRNQTCP
jgi:flagellar basal body-associated protein FliL